MAAEKSAHRATDHPEPITGDGAPHERDASAMGMMGIVPRILVGLIRTYQMTISRALPPSCRFYPSCSEYTLQAVTKYGALKGGWLGVKRILRCHPFHPGGYDPVP